MNNFVVHYDGPDSRVEEAGAGDKGVSGDIAGQMLTGYLRSERDRAATLLRAYERALTDIEQSDREIQALIDSTEED